MEAEPTIAATSPRAPGAAPAPSRLGVLRHRHFRLVLLAAFGSWTGGWFEFVAVRWIVSQETKSEEWMATLAGAQLFPTLVLGMLGGLVADSVNRRRMLVVTQALMMLIALAMAGAAYASLTSPWAWFWLSLAQGLVVPFNMPAWQVLTPRLVPKDEIVRAITMNGIVFNTSRVIGPAIGGAVMKGFGGHGAAGLLLVNAALFVGVMAAVLATPDAPAPPDMRGRWRHPGEAWRRTLEAFGWVWTHRGARSVFIAIVVFALLATPVMQLMPLMVSEVYGKGEDYFGTILAVMGVGAVCGGLAMKLVPRWYPMHHLIPLSVALGGLWIFVYSICEHPSLALVFMFFLGFFWMWGFNSTGAAMQRLVDDSMRGRVSAVVNTIAMGLMPLGTILAAGAGHAGTWGLRLAAPGLVDAGTQTQLALAIPGLVLVVAGAIMLIWRRPEVDGLAPGDAGYDVVPGLWRGVFATAHRPRPAGSGEPGPGEPGPGTMAP